jgi:hypothetical protein
LYGLYLNYFQPGLAGLAGFNAGLAWLAWLFFFGAAWPGLAGLFGYFRPGAFSAQALGRWNGYN